MTPLSLYSRILGYSLGVYVFAHIAMHPDTSGPGEVLAFLGGSVCACLVYVVIGRLTGEFPQE